jgi:hypothetical protein
VSDERLMFAPAPDGSIAVLGGSINAAALRSCHSLKQHPGHPKAVPQHCRPVTEERRLPS